MDKCWAEDVVHEHRFEGALSHGNYERVILRDQECIIGGGSDRIALVVQKIGIQRMT